ncbi:HupE/UreJ family protein [Sulfitobacter sp. F26169L]|uniref:HupE/UreJ family protein n=1 Tax=Sulfitobacter sp. F26169L TaxID=2996015 RepID=UPI002260D405|nr:HupE/UreJ family protein [Sulfitobacter sp. F26169L]MCX7565408.1 HupE/UreJ family protein [Sulfitobacter sp. F26169L]
MKRYSLLLLFKLTLVLALSSTQATAHEVVPTIADLTVAEGKAELGLQINLEAFLAGVDLDTVDDTNNAPQAQDYDALRALDAAQLAARAPELLAGWNALPVLSVDGTPLVVESINITVPEGIDPELPRIAEWQLAADAPEGSAVTVAWPDGGGDLVLRQQGVDEPYTGLISGGANSPEISLEGGNAQTGWQTFVGYIPVGFDHILPKGLDHILFVLGLFFLSTHLRPLIWQVTAFTLAHTVTLALGALGVVTVPGSIVEPLIAASIVYVAVENIFARGLNTWRPVIIFGFGLLHGLGFASVLGEFGLPQAQFVPALIGFNVGVEIGQLTVITMAFVLIWLAVLAARRASLTGVEEIVTEYPVMFRAVSVTGSLLIAIIGIYWVIERTLL